jgi:hypothetical protein
MKQTLKKLCVSLLTLFAITGNAQTYCSTSPANCELVCNGGFETVTGYPSSFDQLYLATGWTVYYNTPDLFSSFSSVGTSVNVPCNSFGYQYGHNGSNNYAGLLLNGSQSSHFPYAWWEGITTNFSSTLASGKTYDVSFWVSAADLNNVLNQNLLVDINANFTYTVSPSLLNTKNNWVLVSFPFCAEGGETYMTIRSIPSFTPVTSTPQVTTGCTFTTSAAPSYIYLDDVSVKESKFTVASATGCLNTPVNLSLTSLCGVNTANYTYVWNFGDGSSPVTTGTTTSHLYGSFGVFTGSVSVNANGCSNTYTFSVNIPSISVAVTTNTNTICNAVTNFTATPSPTGSYTYTWSVKDASTGLPITMPAGSTGTNSAIASINFAGIYQNVNVCAAITNTLGCSATQCYYMPSCCSTPTTVVKYANYTFTANTTVSTASVSFGGTITVNSGVTLTLLNTRAQMDPNTKFVINGTGSMIVTNSYLYGCNAMWNGMYPLSASTVSITNSRVEDAQRVVIDSLGGANVILTNNYINKNYMGVVFKATKTSTSVVTIKNNLFTCSSIAAPIGTAFVPTTPNLTNAPTLGTNASVYLLPPYNTTKSYCGLSFMSASKTGAVNTLITIGGNVGDENIFDKMQFGVYSFISRTAFQNNVFQNIKASIAPSGGINAGIVALGPIFSGSAGYMTVGGVNSGFKNTFTNNDYGVYNVSQSILSITYNRFETQGTGITVTGNNNNSSVITSQNKFINNLIGINYDQNTLIDATISENWFDNPIAQGSGATNFAIRTTEVVTATTATNSPKYVVINNYMNGYYNGTYAAHTLQSSIRDNEVHMIQSAGGDFQFGIHSVSSNNNDIYNNLVDMPSLNTGAWWQAGIFTDQATVPIIHCNSINNLYVAIGANSFNNTAPGYGIFGNTMQNAVHGFHLDASGNIGDQFYAVGTASYSADNSWISCTNETYVNTGSNSLGAKFFTRASSPYNIVNPFNVNPSTPLLGFNTTGYTQACYLATATPTLNLRVSGANAQAKLMQRADDIATGNLNFGANDANLKHIARKQLYNQIAVQQIDPAVTAGINTFVTNYRTLPLGQFFMVDSLINASDSIKLNQAYTLNSSINATNDVDMTQQQFNNLYIAYLQNKRKVSNNNITTLETMASLCPSAYGQAVHQARNLLFNITHKQYRHKCEKSDDNDNHRMASAPYPLERAGVRIYPNPSAGNITIETADDLSYNLTVYNVLGEKLIDVTVANKQSINLNSLPSATYIVLINYNGSLVKTERISIIH